MEEQATSTPVSLRGFKFKVRNQFSIMIQNGDFAWVIFAIKFPEPLPSIYPSHNKRDPERGN